MTHSSKFTIKDIPMSQLKPLHDLQQVSADDVRASVSAPFRQFADQIAAAFNGQSVDVPDQRAEALNEQAAKAAQQSVSRHSLEDQPSAPQHSDSSAGPEEASSEPAAPALDLAAEWERIRLAKAQKTQVNEADYINIPGFKIDAKYEFREQPGWVPPGIKFEVEVPAKEEAEDSAEDVGYGAEPEPQPEDNDQRHPVRLWWPELEHAPNELVIYRVVGADSVMNPTPEDGEDLVFTQGTAYRDHNPGEQGLRHYAVWAYKGKGLEEVINSQPYFMGETAVVFPPTNVQVSTIKGAIQVSWDLLHGHESALVYACRDTEKDVLSPRFEQAVDSSGLKATIPVQEAGQTMVISLLGQAQFRDATEQSPDVVAVQRTVKMASELEKMELTRCEGRRDGGEDKIEMDWYSPKTGEVKIYLTPNPPQAELRTAAVPKTYVESALASAIAESRGTTEPGSFQTANVPWPSDWYEIYVTPVNFNDADAWVGESKVLQRVQSIEEDQYRLIERVDSQLITFDWPQGATAVEYTTSEGVDQVREEDYDLQGGIRLRLKPHGETVTLQPYAVFAGKRTVGDKLEITYEGLRPVTYDIIYDFMQGTADVFVWSLGNGDKREFTCQMVYRPDRLPLYPEDGQVLTGIKDGVQQTTFTFYELAGEPMAHAKFTVDLREHINRGGYIRLFAVESADSGYDSSFTGFGNEDLYSNFAGGESDSSSNLSALDKAVVVEKDVANKLHFAPQDYSQNQQYSEDYAEQYNEQYYQGGQ